LLATLVLFAGIGFGGAVVFLLQKLDETVLSSADLTTEFNIRVLGSVSVVESNYVGHERRRSSKKFALASGGLVCIYACFMALTQLYQLSNFVSKGHLPAVLQRILDYAG
jgi:uncharacterized membrane protein YhiD involved in acid resistance